MLNAFALFRSLVVYGVCLPLAIFLGYLLANPEDMTNDAIVATVLVVLLLPILLRWHYPLLIFSWNMTAILFFVPGKPVFWFFFAAVSFTVSILQYALNRKHQFLSAPSVGWSLICLGAVVLMTARLTGGIGIRAAGSDSFGGKKYIWILMSVLGYFAITARQIPSDRVFSYVRMYFLGTLSAMIGSLATVLVPGAFFLFLIFPPDVGLYDSVSPDASSMAPSITRMAGVSASGSALACMMLALMGIRGIFMSGKPFRLLIFLVLSASALLGGYRSSLLIMIGVFAVQFYLEGLMRTRLLPALMGCGLFVAVLVLPFANRLPLSVQRTISFLPVKIDQVAAMDAEGSFEWRMEMWKRGYQDVPSFLLLGKGCSINPGELAMIGAQMTRGEDRWEGAYLAGDYHSGPLSILLPFGIWGALAFTWFLWASTKVLYQNFLFGDPAWKTINTFLLASFVSRAIFFIGIFGSLHSDLPFFVGLVGFSVAINGGVRQPAPAPVTEAVPNRLQLITAMR